MLEELKQGSKLVGAKQTRRALKDGRADREQYFDLPAVDEKTGEVMEETPAETVGRTDSAPKQVSLSDL